MNLVLPLLPLIVTILDMIKVMVVEDAAAVVIVVEVVIVANKAVVVAEAIGTIMTMIPISKMKLITHNMMRIVIIIVFSKLIKIIAITITQILTPILIIVILFHMHNI